MRSANFFKITPLKATHIPVYVETGALAYREHYCHLWPGGDPRPYIRRNFTKTIVEKEFQNKAFLHWLVYSGDDVAGICKLDLDKMFPGNSSQKSVFIEKIYLRKQFTGKGLGSALFRKIESHAMKLGSPFLWLEAMQKGPALSFYLNNGFKILGTTQVPYPEVRSSEKMMWVLGRELQESGIPTHSQ